MFYSSKSFIRNKGVDEGVYHEHPEQHDPEFIVAIEHKLKLWNI